MPRPVNKGRSLPQVMLGQLDSHVQKNEVRLLLHTIYTSINSKWVNNLNIRAKSLKFLEENIGLNLYDLKFGNRVLVTIQNHNYLKNK